MCGESTRKVFCELILKSQRIRFVYLYILTGYKPLDKYRGRRQVLWENPHENFINHPREKKGEGRARAGEEEDIENTRHTASIVSNDNDGMIKILLNITFRVQYKNVYK